MIYTGVGSRQTPAAVCKRMTELAYRLDSAGYILRSGAAEGADTAFEAGAGPDSEIYLPWRGFNFSTAPFHGVSDAAFKLAKTVHPRWQALPTAVRALHARNCYQVLGPDLNAPSDFLVCWTPDGCEKEADRTSATGGTGTAIVLARRHNIRVFNLYNPGSRRRLIGYLLEQEVNFPESWISKWLGETHENS